MLIAPPERKRSASLWLICHAAVAASAAYMHGTEEKGVDVRMTTNIINLTAYAHGSGSINML